MLDSLEVFVKKENAPKYIKLFLLFDVLFSVIWFAYRFGGFGGGHFGIGGGICGGGI